MSCIHARSRSSRSLGYIPSKTALNAITVAFANQLRSTPIKVNAVCPGYTATDSEIVAAARS